MPLALSQLVAPLVAVSGAAAGIILPVYTVDSWDNPRTEAQATGSGSSLISQLVPENPVSPTPTPSSSAPLSSSNPTGNPVPPTGTGVVHDFARKVGGIVNPTAPAASPAPSREPSGSSVVPSPQANPSESPASGFTYSIEPLPKYDSPAGPDHFGGPAVANYDPATGVATLHDSLPGDMRAVNEPRTSNDPRTITVGVRSGLYRVRWNSDGGPQSALLTVSASPKKPTSDVVVIVPDFTWQAYNKTGGGNLYVDTPANGIALLRPLATRGTLVSRKPTRNPIQFIRSVHGEPDIITQSALHDNAKSYDLSEYKLIVLYGHDEYWTTQVRNEIESAVRQGTNMLNMSGNTAWHTAASDGVRLRRTGVWYRTSRPEMRLTGVSFRFAGYTIDETNSGVPFSLDQYEELVRTGFPNDVPYESVLERVRGFRVLNASDPLYAGTNLQNGDWFGYKYWANNVETDGYPLRADGSPNVAAADGNTPAGFVPLAEGWNFRGDKFLHSAPIVRARVGKGKVITFGSIGWTGALLKGENNVKTMTRNAIKELTR